MQASQLTPPEMGVDGHVMLPLLEGVWLVYDQEYHHQQLLPPIPGFLQGMPL